MANLMKKEKTSELANELKTIRRIKVYEEISQQIEGLIQTGKLKPGDKLPTERELSEFFNVSRHSVREAIRVLEKSRLINSVAGSGTYVAMSENQETIQLIATYLLEKTDKLAEIFQLRRIIEPQVADLAAENATEDDIKRLEQLLEKHKEFIANGITNRQIFLELDIQLHTTIAKATRNSIIPNIIERLNDLFHETRKEGYLSKIRMKTSTKGHIEIIQSILQGNTKLAVNSMEKHLKDVERTTIKHLLSTSLNKSKEKELD